MIYNLQHLKKDKTHRGAITRATECLAQISASLIKKNNG